MVLGFWSSSQTAEHDVSHRKVNLGAAASDRGFVFAAEQAITVQPAERPFHDPAVRKNFESIDIITAFHDFQFSAKCLSRCFDQFACVATIGPDDFESRFTTRFLEHQIGSVTILNAGGCDDHRDQQPQRIDQNISFASFHVLLGIVTAFAPSLRGLAVHDRRRGRCLPTVLISNATSQSIV